jgi:hypothetical protein
MSKVAIASSEDVTQSKCIHSRSIYAGANINFNHQVTLSPALQDEAWDNLNMNTRAAEFHSLPVTLHNSLIHALQSFKFA